MNEQVALRIKKHLKNGLMIQTTDFLKLIMEIYNGFNFIYLTLNEIESYLNRTDLTANLDTFIDLAESRLNGKRSEN